MNIKTRLDNLFNKWEEAHRKNAKVLNLQHPERFLPDGIVGDETTYLKASPKVLYILKESNSGDSVNNDFWFKKEVLENGTHIITKRIQLMQKMITGSTDLTTIAYMNLNKSGGNSASDMAHLKAYSLNNNISPLIKEQVLILDPDIIICAGCYRIVSGILGVEINAKIIDMWHPSYSRVPDEKYLSHFKKKLELISISTFEI